MRSVDPDLREAIGQGGHMAIYLSHESALRYWLTKRGDEEVPDAASEGGFVEARASMREIRRAALPVDFSKERPLHVLVPGKRDYRTLEEAVTHVCSERLPSGSFCELSGSVRVCSPELTYYQMSRGHSIPELVEVGCHLCGGFSVGDEGHGYTGRREPLTTPDQIRGYLERMGGAYGTARALKALDFVSPRAASPMEVLLVMTFVLPPALGGWDMPEISVNQRIEVDERLRVLVGTDHFVGDIYLPTVRGDVEFDSREFHSGKYRLDHTQARRNVLEAMGVKTMSATYGQIDRFDKFEAFIEMLKGRFGIPSRTFDDGERSAQIELHEHLTDVNASLF